MEIVDTERGPFIHPGTKNLDQYGGLGLDLAVPIDELKIGTLAAFALRLERGVKR